MTKHKKTKDEVIKYFTDQLAEIHSKSEELKERAIRENQPNNFEPIEFGGEPPEGTPLTLAWKAAEKLHKEIKEAYDTLKNAADEVVDIDDNTLSYELEKKDLATFQLACTKAIEKARPELETHRGWKEVLGNLALAVLGVGIVYAIAGLINKAATGNFLFFKTDSEAKLDKLEEALKDICQVIGEDPLNVPSL